MYIYFRRIMAVSINEICENTKLAREMALTGNYDTSGVYYQGVVQQIHRLLANIADATRKAKWQLVQHQIVQEFEKVKATSNTLQLFKVDTHGERLLGTIIYEKYLIRICTQYNKYIHIYIYIINKNINVIK